MKIPNMSVRFYSIDKYEPEIRNQRRYGKVMHFDMRRLERNLNKCWWLIFHIRRYCGYNRLHSVLATILIDCSHSDLHGLMSDSSVSNFSIQERTKIKRL